MVRLVAIAHHEWLDINCSVEIEEGASRTTLSERRESKENKRFYGPWKIVGHIGLFMWYVYILKFKNRAFYTGVTNNLGRRFKEHESKKGGRFTRINEVDELLYSEIYNTKSEALQREAQIKGWTRKKKLNLIQNLPSSPYAKT